MRTLPTPCARDGKGPGHQYGLPDLIERRPLGSRPQLLLPTPTAVACGSNRSPSPGASTRPGPDALARQHLLPTPTVADSRSSANATANRTVPLVGHAGRTLTDAARLLPTPRATDGAKGCPGQRGSHGDLTLPSAAVQVAVQVGRVLPTPTVSDSRGPGTRDGGGPNLRTTITTLPPGPLGPGGPVPDPQRWGSYAHAVARWEALLGRPVPDPTQPGRHGKPVLAPPFVEWLMGLEHGWVTDLGMPRTLALKVLGNGVVPQQAAVALRLLLCPHRWAAPR
ncbi:hypothetical protein [Virgisporangium aurantiacum]|uniref:DNA (Cytosine-5)-methyltransferase 1 n=1 Tax=Virgisporangium aurantiacum TaxID=175570 RepID=A0A8J4E7U6_9ACTN|nr:hypothetical protein [Virgisporangium aurantiacum]GIJ64573.1 hypothetical protein Vau01_120890 [Virgisporangium aurantiacum]